MIKGHDFAGRTGGNECYAFDIDVKSSAAALRRIADQIEAGTIMMQSVTVSDRTEKEDFTITTLAIAFAEKP
jgi:hypothetical protein